MFRPTVVVNNFVPSFRERPKSLDPLIAAVWSALDC